MTKPLLIEHDDGVDRVTLNRPDSLNALDPALIDALNDYFQSLQRNRTTRVVVLKGAGPAFCAGLDLKEQNRGGTGLGASTTDTVESQRRMSDLVVAMRRAPQPFIAAIRGPAAGGGFALALACDVRIAGESARFNAAFIRIGLSACDMGVSYFLPRAVGSSVASELMLTGRFINAQRAFATGLVSELMPDAEVDAAAAKLALEMTETSPLGLRLTKECLSMSIDAGSLEQAVAIEDRNQVLCVRAGYIEEGARAFLEKRKPRFTPRA
ncbi:enoyl-CoA hydratase/isomerase family protein [Candidatus Binatus sp.]|uniref:enoyl-CoA hydratase/isomerase family protein n=1 Tax=Candidatus Binatus sp. TaxID=2811406 RepID=UPI003C6F1B96